MCNIERVDREEREQREKEKEGRSHLLGHLEGELVLPPVLVHLGVGVRVGVWKMRRWEDRRGRVRECRHETHVARPDRTNGTD